MLASLQRRRCGVPPCCGRSGARPAAGRGGRRGRRRAARAGCGRRTRRRGSTASCGGGAHGRQQRGLGDRHRHLVVAALDAEVAGQPAAAADRVDRRRRRRRSSAASASQPITACWWQCGWATAVHAGRSGGVQPAVRGEQLGEGAGRGARPGPARGSSGSSSAQVVRSTAVHDGSSPTIGMPRRAAPVERVQACARSCRRAPSSWPVEIQVSPQHTGLSVICTE